jgi:hypothetical protein
MGGGVRCLGERALGAAAFGQVAGLGPIVRIALGVALGVLESDGLRLAALGGRLRPVEAKEEGLLATKLLPVRLAARLLPRGPACRLRFRNAAVNLGPASGIPASRDGPEVVRDLRPPRGPTSLLFLCQRGTSQRACDAVITPICSEGRVDEGRGRGSHDAFLLDLACSTEASG